MRRLVSSLAAVALLLMAPPVWAEPSPVAPAERPVRSPSAQAADPSVAAVERALGEIGAWSLEYSAVLTSAAELMDEIEGYTAILDRVANRQVRTRTALEQMQAWRANAISRAQAVRERAVALPQAPSLRALGEEMAALEGALVLARGELPTLIDEMIASLEAWAAYGAEAIRDTDEVSSTRLRAVYASSIQLIRIDTRRISASARALPADHPNRQLMEAMIAYEAGISAFPLHELRKVDGENPDSRSVATTLRSYANEMNSVLARAETNAQRMEREMRETVLPPEAEQMRDTILRMTQTYPESVRIYRQLARSLDDAASSIEAGGEPVDAWAHQEQVALPIFEQATRIEESRLQLAANFRR